MKTGDLNGFLLACYDNPNLHIIKYLVNDLNFDINVVNYNGYNGLSIACRHNENLEIIKYLIKDLYLM